MSALARIKGLLKGRAGPSFPDDASHRVTAKYSEPVANIAMASQPLGKRTPENGSYLSFPSAKGPHHTPREPLNPSRCRKSKAFGTAVRVVKSEKESATGIRRPRKRRAILGHSCGDRIPSKGRCG
ncbi:hypothetical protein MRX96_027765 [Rhipicephalus microplus]